MKSNEPSDKDTSTAQKKQQCEEKNMITDTIK